MQTLHYYERVGLLQKPKRSAANYRLYSPEAVRRVQFIKKAQAVGLTLGETKQILDLKDRGRRAVKSRNSEKNICMKSTPAWHSCAPTAAHFGEHSVTGETRTRLSGNARANFAI
ncbi:MAG: MerR family transcriptional regulator [Blastocatellia bacterium]|nr:MerR family transcriptional regulator [Blastocatellia bacterium]